MSYATVQAALLTAIRTTDEFDADNSVEGDERLLAKGKQKVCILRYGGHAPEAIGSPNRWAFRWTVIVDLWFRGRGELKFYNSDIASTVQSVLNAILAYPTLNGTAGVTHVQPGDASDPDRWQGELRDWWVVSFPVIVTEVVNVTIAE